jgi:aminoglycoside/choline kinase family phosphotransferase
MDIFVHRDFQDARSGSTIYDFVSLPRHSYIDIGNNIQEIYVQKFYNSLVERSIWRELDDYQKLFDYTII